LALAPKGFVLEGGALGAFALGAPGSGIAMVSLYSGRINLGLINPFL
jgi:hypothetical protein